MRRLALAVAVTAGALVLAGSVFAFHVPTTGSPIRLLVPSTTPATFAASTPFFVRHGYVCLPEELSCKDSTTEFRLYVDSHRAPTALELELNLACPVGVTPSDGCSSRRNVANFRFGLPAGTHSFRGEWWNRGQLEIVREATIDFVG